MSHDDDPGSDHSAIVAAWVRGWAITREVLPPVAHADGFRVEVGLPRQRARYVFPQASDALRQLGGTLVEPWVFLKACGPTGALRAVLPPCWTIEPTGFMMTCGDARFPAPTALPSGYLLEVSEDSPRAHVRIVTRDDGVAASGHIALDKDHAFYDRIVTEPEHQRRGLGRIVMGALQRVAHAHGRRRGVLVATEPGRGLYEAIGWRLHSIFATAVILDETLVKCDRGR